MQYFIVSPRRRSRAVLADDAPVWRMPSFNILSAPVEAPVCRGVVLESRDTRDVGAATPPHFGASGIGTDRRGVLPVPDVIRGKALVYGRQWLPGPILEADWRTIRTDGWRVIVFPHALDECLVDLKAGRLRLPLLLNHDDRYPLAWSDEDVFRLRPAKDGGSIRFRLSTDSTAGRLAGRVIVSSGFRGLSLGLHAMQTVEAPGMPLCMGIVKARLRDVSVVERNRCPGATLTL